MSETKTSKVPMLLSVLSGAWVLWVLVRYVAKVGIAFRYLVVPFDASAFPPVDGTVFWKVTAQSLRILLTAAVVGGVASHWGARLGKFLGVELSDPWVRIGTHLGLGILFLDLLWLSTGLNGLWWKEGLVLLWAGLILDWLFSQPWRTFTLKREWVGFPKGPAVFLLAGLGLLYWGFALLQGLLPETFYDSMVYHLAVPWNWLLRHGIGDLPGQFFSNYPFGGELFYLNGLFLQGTECARCLHVLAFLATALVAGGWAREEGGTASGWLTLGLVLTLPLFVINASTTQVEVLLSFFLLLGAYFLFKPGPGARAAALLFLAQACAIKYTAGLAVVSLGLGLVWSQRASVGKGLWRTAILGLGAAAVTFLPWWVKNLVFTADPFFPYGGLTNGGRSLPVEGFHALLTEQQGRIAHGWDCLALPWTAVLSNPNGFNFIGPMALALFPLGLVWASKGPWKGFGRITLPLYFLLGFGITHILRFLSAGVVWIYLLVGARSGSPGREKWRAGLAWAGVVSAVVCSGFLAAIAGYFEPGAGIWSGRQDRDSYLGSSRRMTPYYPMARWFDLNSPKDLRILVVGDARGLYYPRPFVSNSVFDAQELARLARAEKDPAGIRKRLKEEGVDALAVNAPEGIRVAPQYGHYNLSSEEWARLDEFIQDYTELAYFRNDEGVYRLLSEPKPGKVPEIPDLVLFFSEPAAHFAQAVDRRQWPEARAFLDQAVGLYPFSALWKEQKRKFDEAFRSGKGMNP